MQFPAVLICTDLYVLQLQRLAYKYPQLGQGQTPQPLHKWGLRCRRGRMALGPGKQKLRKILGELLIAVIQGLEFFLTGKFFFIPHTFVYCYSFPQWFTFTVSKNHSCSPLGSQKLTSKQTVLKGASFIVPNNFSPFVIFNSEFPVFPM